MSSKLLAFFVSMFLFMTYGMTHLHPTPSLLSPLTPSCTAFADDDEIDTPEEIADELDDVTEEEELLEDQEEVVEEQDEEVVEEVKKK